MSPKGVEVEAAEAKGSLFVYIGRQNLHYYKLAIYMVVRFQMGTHLVVSKRKHYNLQKKVVRLWQRNLKSEMMMTRQFLNSNLMTMFRMKRSNPEKFY